MKVFAEVISIGQRLDMETRQVVHTLELLLPDGSKIAAPVGEEDAQRVICLCIGEEEETSDEYVSSDIGPVRLCDEPVQVGNDEVTVFGAEPSPVPSGRQPVPFPETPLKNKYGTVRRSQRHIPVKTVSKDEAGNPIAAARSAPVSLPASGLDEDGIPAM